MLLLLILLLLLVLFLFILRFAVLCLIPSQVRSIHPFTQALNLTDTLSVTFHNTINIYNHRRHPHSVQTTPAYRIPHSLASSHLFISFCRVSLGHLLNLTQCQLFLSICHLAHSYSFTECFLCRLLSQPDECLTNYDPHGYCVIYSAADRSSFSIAEQVLQVLWTNQNIAQKAVILVSNKADLARSRLVTSEGKYKKRNVGADEDVERVDEVAD